MIEFLKGLPETSKSVIVSSVIWVIVLWLLSPYIESPAKQRAKPVPPKERVGAIYAADLTHFREKAFTIN